jgi:hypothetical protein
MTEQNEINVYSDFSKKAQEVAPKIEKLLNGLDFNEAERVIFRLLNEIKKRALITSFS